MRARAFVPVTLETLTLSIGSSVTLETTELELQRSALEGTVTSSDPQELNVSGALVSILRTASPRGGEAASPYYPHNAATNVVDPLAQQQVVGPAGNYEFPEVPAGTYEITITKDGAAPVVQTMIIVGSDLVFTAPASELRPLTGSFEILGSLADGSDSSNYTTKRDVSLNLFGFNAAQMLLGESDGTSCTYGPVTTFDAQASLMLSDGDGLKTVCVRFIDSAGNETEDLFGQIVLDTQPPAVQSLEINNGAEVIASSDTVLSILGLDAGSGLASMSLTRATEGSVVDLNSHDYAVNFVDSGLGEGTTTYFLRIKDLAGWESPVASSQHCR